MKKHEFAHPQTLLTCNTCRYTAVTQTDLNRHMLHAHRPHDIAGRGGAEAGYTALLEQTGSGVQQPEDSVTPPGGIGTEQHQIDFGHHGQRVDAICNLLGRTDEYPALKDVVVKQERTDDIGDGIGYCSNATPQVSGQMHASSAERIISNIDHQQTTAVLPGIHEAFSHRSPLQQLSPTHAGIPTTSVGFSQSMSDYGHKVSDSRQPDTVVPHPVTFLSFPVAAHTQSLRRRPTAQLPPIAQVSLGSSNVACFKLQSAK